jgi:hypothetical protein
MAETKEAPVMPPAPHPALKRLERYVGRWTVTGRTLDAEEDNVSGRLEFEWLPRCVLPATAQRVQLRGL